MSRHTTLTPVSLCIDYSLCLEWPTHFAKLTPNSLTHLRKLLTQEVELIFLWAKVCYTCLCAHHTALYLYIGSFPLLYSVP